MSFTDEEVAYLRSQPLGRLSTVAEDGQPDVVPVGYDFDGTYIYVSGYGDTLKTRKFRNVLAGNRKVALVVDDLVSTSPWTPRFLRIYGTAEVVERDGYVGQGTYLRITPTISWSWNLDGRPFTGEAGGNQAEPRATRTVHRPPSQDQGASQPDVDSDSLRPEGGGRVKAATVAHSRSRGSDPLPVPQAGVERVADAVAEQVERQHG